MRLVHFGCGGRVAANYDRAFWVGVSCDRCGHDDVRAVAVVPGRCRATWQGILRRARAVARRKGRS